MAISNESARPELRDEVAGAPAELRAYAAGRCAALLNAPAFLDALPGLIFPDESQAARLTILTQRLEQLAALA